MKTMNRFILHVEGLAVLILSVFFYFSLDFSWVLFVVLLFIPDISMIGYMYNTSVGAIFYNIFHSYILPIAVVGIGTLFSVPVLLAVGLIWISHIGMDRMIGYGLKYPTDFKDTHMQRI
ncbi:DUF4260 domain-containing protein [Virgibacillus kekensis]|uniref:DUF4260 domain-containing protein n=1 Tax=Virgibacillus kekensis TaxID=202261 RepID=A0ABV9DN36_9BACI